MKMIVTKESEFLFSERLEHHTERHVEVGTALSGDIQVQGQQVRILQSRQAQRSLRLVLYEYLCCRSSSAQ